MIPYFDQPTLTIGPFSLNAFGALVMTGILVSVFLIRQRAKFLGLDVTLTERMSLWVLITAFIMAHFFEQIAYYPQETLENPFSLLRVWEGMSSYGGFIGAVLGYILFVKVSKMGSERWHYLDVAVYAFPVGWFFGRVGCFIAYDHPGTPTTFFLGQEYSDGIIRHNLGLEEAIYTFAIVVLFIFLGNKRVHPVGFFSGLFSVLYAPVRFFLDFLRMSDARYFGLTPGQYGSIILFLLGIWLLRRSKLQKPQINEINKLD